MNFFKNLTHKKEFTKRVSLYISETDQQIIIAPTYRNDAGLYYEQENCRIIKYPLDNSLLGVEIINNLNLCKLKDKNLRGQKLSDWPAYKSSKLRTVKAFEKNYVAISISGANESNISLVFKVALQKDNDLITQSSISLYSEKTLIGKLAMKVYYAHFGIFNNNGQLTP